MMPIRPQKKATLARARRTRFFLPAEHGAWVWLCSPLMLGAAAARGVTPELGITAAAALTAFLLRQPVTVAVKALSGRRPADDLAPAVVWVGIYTALLAPLLGALAWAGHAQVVLLGMAAAPFFGYYLWLVVRRDERKRLGMDLAATAFLALAAPAAYWSAGGAETAMAVLVWSVAFLHHGVAAVQVVSRLPRRQFPTPLTRHSGWLPFLLNAVNLVAAGAAAHAGWTSWLVAAAFGLPVADAVLFALRPPATSAPRTLGLRQLATSTAFTAAAAAGLAL